MNVIKSHCAANTLAEDAPTKVVTVFRDPKEVIKSAQAFLLGSWGVTSDVVDTDEWVDTLFKQGGLMAELANHSASYWNRRHLDNYLFVNYRDMKADPLGHIKRIATLMNVELTPSELEKVREKSSVAYMKGINHKFGAASPETHEVGTPTTLVRSGKSGTAVEELGLHNARRIDAHMKAMLLEMAPDFPYDEFCNVAY